MCPCLAYYMCKLKLCPFCHSMWSLKTCHNYFWTQLAGGHSNYNMAICHTIACGHSNNVGKSRSRGLLHLANDNFGCSGHSQYTRILYGTSYDSPLWCVLTVDIQHNILSRANRTCIFHNI